jgi:hypothetical protein
MPDLASLMQGSRRPPAFGGAQCYEATVKRVTGRGAWVVIPAFDRKQLWGPCLPPDAAVSVGDKIAVAMSDQGVPWVVSGAGQPRFGPEDAEHG